MPTTSLKSDSNTGVFLLILKDFEEQYLVKHLRTDIFFDSVDTFQVSRFYHRTIIRTKITCKIIPCYCATQLAGGC